MQESPSIFIIYLALFICGLSFIALAWLLVVTLKRKQNEGSHAVELKSLRGDVADNAQRNRQELVNTFSTFTQTLFSQSSETNRTQNAQLDAVAERMTLLQKNVADSLALAQTQTSTTLTQQLQSLGEGNERRLAEMRDKIDQRLRELQTDNEKKLEQMRQTVDEKLHATLEARLGESFKQVAERLELVHRGLGEMQTLAQGVGDLKRVLTNVKTRGIFGEVQLGAVLEQMFAPDQYAANVETVPGTNARVEYAIKLPGQGTLAQLWLPIDAKFPREDYERLLEAQERADVEGAEAAAKALEMRLRLEAKSINNKYLAAPYTSEFGILFVPTEGLYAEALRRPGLVEALQREHKVVLAGPTTLSAMLSSLQMGFRTLALEKRSSEVWQVLGAVKTEFNKFGDILEKTRKKLEEAQNTIGDAQQRTRVMGRKLREVEELPANEVSKLLPLVSSDSEPDEVQ
jgi:DNA recombination protein RmuC